MRLFVLALALLAGSAAAAKEKATFLAGQYATADQCVKLRKIEAGGPKNVGTVPELLDADGFKGWEGGCAFTKVFEHEPGRSWLALMICTDGNATTPETYVFTKNEGEDSFEVDRSDSDDGPATYMRCDAKKGN